MCDPKTYICSCFSSNCVFTRKQNKHTYKHAMLQEFICLSYNTFAYLSACETHIQIVLSMCKTCSNLGIFLFVFYVNENAVFSFLWTMHWISGFRFSSVSTSFSGVPLFYWWEVNNESMGCKKVYLRCALPIIHFVFIKKVGDKM